MAITSSGSSTGSASALAIESGAGRHQAASAPASPVTRVGDPVAWRGRRLDSEEGGGRASRSARCGLPALAKAGITKPLRVWHGLRHTALTHEAAVNSQSYVQMRAGHSQGAITERYVHAAQVAHPGAADRSEERIFAAVEAAEVPSSVPISTSEATSGAGEAAFPGSSQLPGLDSNQQPSG